MQIYFLQPERKLCEYYQLKKGGNMKLFSLITLSIVLGGFTCSNALAIDKLNCIYGSKINQMISFYQGRLYLTDSEYTILSDIGKDAKRMVNYLQERKKKLIKEMKESQVEVRSRKIRTYVVNKARVAVLGSGYIKF